MVVEIKGGCEGYGDMPSVWRKVVVARHVGERLKGRMGYSGDSGGGGDFLARILV